MAATYTSRLNLAKPDRQDFVSVVNDINNNMQKIDDEAVARNQDIRWTNAVSISQFINDCESAMPNVKGIYYLGYINWAALQNWGNIDFNGFVLGLYHTSEYKSIFIVTSGGQVRIAKFAKINGTWNQTPYQVVENRYMPGDAMNSYCIGYGFITDSGKTIRIIVPSAKLQTSIVSPVLQSGSRFEIRGTSGYVDGFGPGNSTEIVGNASYTVSVSRINEGAGIIIVIQKTTAFGNITNNTPISAVINPLKINFNAAT